MVFSVDSIDESKLDETIAEVKDFISESRKKMANDVKTDIDNLMKLDHKELENFVSRLNFSKDEFDSFIKHLREYNAFRSMLDKFSSQMPFSQSNELKLKIKKAKGSLDSLISSKLKIILKTDIKKAKILLDWLEGLKTVLYGNSNVSLADIERFKKSVDSLCVTEESKEIVVKQLNAKLEFYLKQKEEEERKKIQKFNEEAAKMLLDEVEDKTKSEEEETNEKFNDARKAIITGANEINEKILKSFCIKYLIGVSTAIFADDENTEFFREDELINDYNTYASCENLALLMRFYICKISNEKVSDEDAKDYFKKLSDLAVICSSNMEIMDKLNDCLLICNYLKNNFYMEESWYGYVAKFHNELDKFMNKMNFSSINKAILLGDDFNNAIVKVNSVYAELSRIKEELVSERFKQNSGKEKQEINGFVLTGCNRNGNPYLVEDFSPQSGLVDLIYRTYDYKPELIELISDLVLTGSFRAYDADDFHSSDKVYYGIGSRNNATMMYRLRVRKTSPLRFVERLVILKQGTRIYEQVVGLLKEKCPNITIKGDFNLYVNIANGLKNAGSEIYDKAIHRHDSIGIDVLGVLFKDGVYFRNVKTSGILLKEELSDEDLRVLSDYIDISLEAYRKLDDKGVLSFITEGNGQQNKKSF